MTELRMIPDTSDKEVDWELDPDAGRELASARHGARGFAARCIASSAATC